MGAKGLNNANAFGEGEGNRIPKRGLGNVKKKKIYMPLIPFDAPL